MGGMMKRIWIFFVTMMMLGCGTGKPVDVQQPIESIDEMAVQAASLLPLHMTVSGETEQGRTRLTVHVTYAADITVPVTMMLETQQQTDILGAAVTTLPPGKSGTVREHTFELKGEAESARIVASFSGRGMGAEVYETWSPERSAQVRSKPENSDIMEALPAPIEVEGGQIFRGVEVRP